MGESGRAARPAVDELRQDALLVRRLAVAGVAMAASFGVAAITLAQLWFMGLSLLAFCGIVGLTPWLHRRTRSLALVGDIIVTCVIASICVSGPFRGQMPLVSLAFAVAVPPLALYLGGPRRAMLWSAVVVLLFAGFLAVGLTAGFDVHAKLALDDATWTIIDVAGLTTLLLLMLLVSLWYHRKRERTEAARIEAEKRLMHAQKMESVGNMAGGIAHDFNNVLSVILTISDSAADEVAADSQLGRDLREIRDAALRANELTKQLLSLARRQPDQEDVSGDPTAAAHSVRTMLERALPRTIELTMTIDSRLPTVSAGEGAISQAMLNLVINARDAMKAGGRLQVSMERVEVGTAEGAALGIARGTYVRLRVRDDGEGIPPALRDRIFEPFFTTKGTDKGSGLGLAMVYALAQRASGTVTVDSIVGEGTTFSVYFRRTDGSRASRTIDVPTVVEPVDARAILLVEDDTPVRRATCRLLEDSGYRVFEADSGQAALAALEAEGNDIAMIITDVVMPGMNGRELAQHIDERGLGLPILFISGFTDPKLGPIPENQLLRKPFGRQDLIDQVERRIGQR